MLRQKIGLFPVNCTVVKVLPCLILSGGSTVLAEYFQNLSKSISACNSAEQMIASNLGYRFISSVKFPADNIPATFSPIYLGRCQMSSYFQCIVCVAGLL